MFLKKYPQPVLAALIDTAIVYNGKTIIHKALCINNHINQRKKSNYRAIEIINHANNW